VKVLSRAMRTARLESGPSKLPPSDRVAVVASYGENPEPSRSLLELVRELEVNGYTVVVVRASDNASSLDWPSIAGSDPIIVTKANLGYDFGSWAVGLEMFPRIRRAPYVLLVNDSLVGPFASLKPLIDSFESAPTDAWAATNTTQIHEHLQSFFVGYRHGVLADRALRQFWRHLPEESEKQNIIERYEFGLSRLLLAEGLTTSACFESERVVSPTENPTVEGWKRLIELGFPFVKRQLLVDPTILPNGSEIAPFIRSTFGTDPREWL
jgi:lipopolysaccharide biosynthesis protein